MQSKEYTTPAWILELKASRKPAKYKRKPLTPQQQSKYDKGLNGCLSGYSKRSKRTRGEQAMREILNVHFPGFKSEVPLCGFIADFLNNERKIIVEVDGEYHFHRTDKDDARTRKLNNAGYEVVRFTNHEVLKTPHLTVERVTALRGSAFAVRFE